MADELRIDRIRCDGHGMCAELLPEMISLDDWGYPIIKSGVIPPALENLARRAVEACPVLALRLAQTQPISGWQEAPNPSSTRLSA